MKKYYAVSLVAFVVILMIVKPTTVTSKIPFPPAGSTGDNFTKVTCAQSGCHPSPAQAPASGDYLLTIGAVNPPTTVLDDNFKYVQDSTYFIRLVLNASTGRYGFQFSSLTPVGAQAGTFPTPLASPSNTSLNQLATTGRFYVGHLGASSNKDWTFKWKAPVATTGEIRFYFAYNTADNNGQSTGDVIYRDSVVVMPDVSGISPLPPSVEDFKLFPSAIQESMTLNIAMNEPAIVSAKLFSVTGVLATGLFDEKLQPGNFQRSYDLSSLAAGVYVVQIVANGKSFAQKIVKL